MPVTIIAPTSGVLSLGSQIDATTSLIGPIPLDYEWWVSCTDTTGEIPELQVRVPTDGQRDLHFVWGDPGQAIITQHSPTLRNGANVRLLVQLMTPLAVEVESLSIPVVYEGVVGLPVIQQMVQGQGGLTAQEHTWVQDTANAVFQVFQTLSGFALQTPIGSVIAHPARQLMNIIAPCQTITGDGQLELHPQSGIYGVYGILVNFEIVPVGFGRKHGVLDEYVERVVQFAAIYATNDGTRQYVFETKDMYSTDQVWLWREFNPIAVAYSVTPGCQVSVCVLAT